MTPTDRKVKDLIDRHVKWPSDLAYIAARDRVRQELLSTPAHLQTPRITAGVGRAFTARRLVGRVAPLAAAAVVVLAIGAAILWPRGPERYVAGAAGTQVTLPDGSQIEMRAYAELTVEREADGLGIRLHQGDIIVTAAKQRDGHLYVHTRDMTIAVVGTVFLVNASSDGSRVAVIEGEVRVTEGKTETRLRPGEQVATSPTIARRPVTDDIDWTRQADVRQSILQLFMKGIAQTAGTLQPLNAGLAGAPAAQAALEFEEASIRECDPDNLPPAPAGARGGGANSFQMTPGRLYALCLTPATLIRTAYGASLLNPARGGRVGRGMNVNIVYGLGREDGVRVRGGPDWVRDEYYTIEAVAGMPADAETMRGPMLRALLERRFGLKYHIETEQIPARALTIAPGGLKMKEGTCTPSGRRLGAEPRDPSVPAPPPGTFTTVDSVRQNLDAARRGATTSSPCGYVGAANGPNVIMVGAGAGLQVFGLVGPGGTPGETPVINRTGIPDTARFNFVLEYLPDDTSGTQVRPGRQISADSSSVPPAPPYEVALEQQLGLRLEPAQAPREYIVIDAIERPSAN
jgi:uncharacterized protein (TIGR03435 family)